MSDYSVFKVQIAKKGTKCCHSLRRKGLSFQVVADENASFRTKSEKFSKKFSELLNTLANGALGDTE